MYGAKDKVVWFAITSRVVIIVLQLIFNHVLPDHDAGVFISPLEPVQKISVYDSAVDYIFGGLLRWDAQYFLHIAKYGYTYENTLAFSPLYPMAIRCLSGILNAIFFMLNEQSTMTISAMLINFFCFVKSAAVFYDLSKTVLKDDTLAYKAAILYCINPASIFFSACYSEAMFACISFHIMLAYTKNNPYIYLPIGLSALVRSNGLISIGFPVYSWVRTFLQISLPALSTKYKNRLGELVMPYHCRTMLGALIWLFNIVFLSIVPYILLQLYNYGLFCLAGGITVPGLVLKYGVSNKFLVAGSIIPPWCESTIPLAYSYVQQKYWDVGFMQYYTFKQIPNFLLAFPVLYTMVSQSFTYLNDYRVQLATLGSFTTLFTTRESLKKKQYPSDMFVFVIHGLFLTIVCIFFVHIQVSTRLLCSASPLLYWYCAFHMSHKSELRKNSKSFEYAENLNSKWKVFFISQNEYSNNDILILSYFLGYCVIGCIMFPNFLPWT